MTNEYNPDGKEIRFIDSHYKDLFHIPDGSCVQIHYPDEMVVKPCTFIDEYHTQIGYNVFHICQFAEIMERNGASYMPEPEIMGDEAAWKVGKDRILAVQTCEDGYDYTLLDENYNEIDGGQVDNPELSMLEVRRDILESFGLERRELRAMFYEDVMEQAFEVGRQAVVVNDPIAELAFKLDRFAENFDPYEYMDQVDDVQAHIQEIKADLAAGNTAPYREFLNTAIEEAREETAVEVAKVLKSQLDKLDSPKRESVMEKLAQAAEKAAPASPSPKRKEPELKKFKKQTSVENEEPTEVYNSNFMKSQNQTSRSSENKLQEVYISNPNNTNLSDTEMNDNKSNPIISVDEKRFDSDNHSEDYQAYENLVKETIDYESLEVTHHDDMRQVDEIVNLIVETVMCKNDKILIASNWYPASLVKKKFLMLTYSHIEYVLHCMSGNTTKVKNIKKYLLAALFNAPSTMNGYYQAEVNHDMPGLVR